MKTADGRTIVCGSHGREVCGMCGTGVVSDPNKIADSKFFHEHWENVQKATGVVLSAAYDPKCTLNDWADVCNRAQNQIDMLKSLGASIKNGVTTH